MKSESKRKWFSFKGKGNKWRKTFKLLIGKITFLRKQGMQANLLSREKCWKIKRRRWNII
jgi:hypothetical protein